MKRLHDSEIEQAFHVCIHFHRRLLTRINAIQGRSGEMLFMADIYVYFKELIGRVL